MVRVALLFLLVLSVGCERTQSVFSVEDRSDSVVSAELQVCGSKTPLARSGKRFSITRAVACEGEGTVVVYLSDKRTALCRIGYVTPRIEQDFTFVVESGLCEPSSR
jgi:hypothetical protein